MLKLQRLILKVLYRVTKSPALRIKLYDLEIEGYRRRGIQVGKNSLLLNCRFSSSSKGDRFRIGDNCTCTGVTFLGHDASPTLFIDELNNGIHPVLPGSRRSYRKPIEVGDNVFIGFNSTILPGVTIADNCVIAAGSVVTKSIDSSGVYGGNPARFISDIDSYTERYKQRLIESPDCF
ncbi:acyltransferase [Ferrimonas balearica]|uniref:acyltransferase n=1 Tax=Ferrimonas balearica TaxID=44012 RepID=UPI001C95E4AF|nr:acyltransferase [Ferrimonas balearica]MBY5978960.1 acyltransferase [Ferrimonas balearica]